MFTTLTGSKRNLNENSNTVLIFEFELNSNQNLRIWLIRRLTTTTSTIEAFRFQGCNNCHRCSIKSFFS
jgi:hypothetical protein